MSDTKERPAARDPKRPPAPVPPKAGERKGLTGLWRFFQDVRANPIGAFAEDAYREPFFKRTLGGREIWILSDPDAVKHVMLDHVGNYPKNLQQQRRLRPALGNGLLTAESDDWRWQRRAAAPAFQMKRIAGFAPAMAGAATEMLDRWAQEGDVTRDIGAEMMRLTYDVLARTVFGRDAHIDAARMGEAMALYFETAGKTDVAAFLDLPEWVPTPNRLRARPAIRFFKEEVGRVVRERAALLARNAGGAPDDLLTMLLNATDPDTGRPMDLDTVTDNTITFIGAGHETTANALTWVLFLLAEYPWARAQVEAEIARVLGGRPPGADDVAKLVYTRQVIEEAMRLYPPAPIMSRVAREADEIKGYRMAKGANVLIAPWILHRHHTLWEEPDLFDPERFAPEKREAIHRFAYIPFGAGPRICIGMAFAMQEAVILLAAMVQRMRFELAPGQVVMPHSSITLRPWYGLRMRVTRR